MKKSIIMIATTSVIAFTPLLVFADETKTDEKILYDNNVKPYVGNEDEIIKQNTPIVIDSNILSHLVEVTEIDNIRFDGRLPMFVDTGNQLFENRINQQVVDIFRDIYQTGDNRTRIDYKIYEDEKSISIVITGNIYTDKYFRQDRNNGYYNNREDMYRFRDNIDTDRTRSRYDYNYNYGYRNPYFNNYNYNYNYNNYDNYGYRNPYFDDYNYNYNNFDELEDTTIKAIVFDKVSLEPLTLENIFGKDYATIIANEIRKQIEENPQEYITLDKNQLDSISPEQNFYLSNGNVVIIFDTNIMAPGSSNKPIFSIPYQKVRSFKINSNKYYKINNLDLIPLGDLVQGLGMKLVLNNDRTISILDMDRELARVYLDENKYLDRSGQVAKLSSQAILVNGLDLSVPTDFFSNVLGANLTKDKQGNIIIEYNY